jgi:hypothetical protein
MHGKLLHDVAHRRDNHHWKPGRGARHRARDRRDDRALTRPESENISASVSSTISTRDIPGEVVGTRVPLRTTSTARGSSGRPVLALGNAPHLHPGAASHSASVVPFERREHEPRELANELDANEVDPSVPGGHTGRSAVYLAGCNGAAWPSTSRAWCARI